MLYPLRFTPILKELVWGGDRLAALGREVAPGAKVGESWEVSDHGADVSLVANGPLAGWSLRDLIARYPGPLLGTRVTARHGTDFPLLVKYIAAEQPLSVQVHPDDAYAREHANDSGKTEMWYVMEAEPGAELIVGLAPGATRDTFAAALAGGDPAALLQRVPVRTGDAAFIPAGRVHAILPGTLLLEIQQNSDTTYRLYDWGRVGLDGQPRPLHIADGLAVTDWHDIAPALEGAYPLPAEGNRHVRLAACPFFVVDRHDLTQPRQFSQDGSAFRILNVVGGHATLHWAGGAETLGYGDTLLLPAMLGPWHLIPEGAASVVVSYVP